MKSRTLAVFIIAVFIGFLGFSGAADAGLKKPGITPMEGQSEQQQAKDIQESKVLAINETGVDPDALSMQMRSLESRYALYSRAFVVPERSRNRFDRFGYTLLPGGYREIKDVERQMRKVNKQYRRYIKVFSREMNARGYKVKYIW